MIEDKPCDNFNTLVKQCIRDLKENKVCYCYTLKQVEAIRKNFKQELKIVTNECGYTLSVRRK